MGSRVRALESGARATVPKRGVRHPASARRTSSYRFDVARRAAASNPFEPRREGSGSTYGIAVRLRHADRSSLDASKARGRFISRPTKCLRLDAMFVVRINFR